MSHPMTCLCSVSAFSWADRRLAARVVGTPLLDFAREQRAFIDQRNILTLLGLLSEKVPEFVPVEYHKHVGLIEVTADPYPQTLSSPTETFPISGDFGRFTGDRPGVLLSLSKHLVLFVQSLRHFGQLTDFETFSLTSLMPCSHGTSLSSGRIGQWPTSIVRGDTKDLQGPGSTDLHGRLHPARSYRYISIDSAKVGALAEQCDISHLINDLSLIGAPAT
jgi:hypothetical protein